MLVVDAEPNEHLAQITIIKEHINISHQKNLSRLNPCQNVNFYLILAKFN